MDSTEQNDTPGQKSKNPDIVLLSIVSGIAWVGLGAILIYFFQDESFVEVLSRGSEWWFQITAGSIAGLLFGWIGILMMKQPKLRAAVDEYAIMKQVKELDLSPFQVVIVSLIAGITEEVLFRAAIQPILGIWITSVLFIAIHGYIKFGSVPQAIFTLFTFLLSVLLGLLYIQYGVVAAMAAHAVYDFVVLYKLSKETHKSEFEISHR
ncbi:MAG: CPBP family intramembrane metalloprotease [Balneolaceae bacterium]|nr:CPBP family intramembrane metalloprotease [Balneolaceae bacterium]